MTNKELLNQILRRLEDSERHTLTPEEVSWVKNQIEIQKLERENLMAIKSKLASSGIWLTIGGILTGLVFAFKHWITTIS